MAAAVLKETLGGGEGGGGDWSSARYRCESPLLFKYFLSVVVAGLR